MSRFIENIKKRRDKNFQVLSLVASYLNNCPDLVTEEIIEDITGDKKSRDEKAFYSFLSNVFWENEEQAKAMEREYISRAVKQLSPEEYLKNPFLQNISVPKTRVGRWDFGYQSYKPYEGFIYRDLQIESGYVEIPQIGYFTEEFSFPTVFESGREWMAIKPNEIETMKEPIKKAFGNTLVYGLGIGYFSYMISEKAEVTSVTVVERDKDAITLFNDYILPQFPNKHKIKIIECDAFDYAEREMKNGGYDFVFTDLWHDVSDGVDLYVKMKKHEGACPNCRFEYWIEASILSSIRWSIFDGIYKKVQKGELVESDENIEKYLTDNYLKNFVKFI